MNAFNKTILAIGVCTALAVTPAFAADTHDHTAQHGGKIVESGHHHLEVVAKDGSLEVFVSGEDGKAEDVATAKATATVLSNGKKVEIALTGQADGLLKGAGDFIAKGATIVFTLTMPGHAPEQARIKID